MQPAWGGHRQSAGGGGCAGLCREQGGGSCGSGVALLSGTDVGGGYGGVGCFAGSPWREAQQSLMLSGSEREREGKGEKEGQR